jgi:hypothetical protein
LDTEFSDAVETAYGSFGLAWRLLDDIKDIEEDLANGTRSSVYIFLTKDIKVCRNRDNGLAKSNYVKASLSYILQHRIIEKITERICRELESAASIVDNYDMTALANEFRSLYKPLANHQEYL